MNDTADGRRGRPQVGRIETKSMVVSLAVRSGWCRRSWWLWARLPSHGVSGRRTIDVIAGTRLLTADGIAAVSRSAD
jgi:hypothetical protein